VVPKRQTCAETTITWGHPCYFLFPWALHEPYPQFWTVSWSHAVELWPKECGQRNASTPPGLALSFPCSLCLLLDDARQPWWSQVVDGGAQNRRSLGPWMTVWSWVLGDPSSGGDVSEKWLSSFNPLWFEHFLLQYQCSLLVHNLSWPLQTWMIFKNYVNLLKKTRGWSQGSQHHY
jgi:hypothetical protein